jgi:hypothetical protein
VAEAVYILCFLTSALVAFLLLRAYRRTRMPVLLWCAIGFVGLCLNNFLLVIDFYTPRLFDLSVIRQIPALLGATVLVFGLIWESD